MNLLTCKIIEHSFVNFVTIKKVDAMKYLKQRWQRTVFLLNLLLPHFHKFADVGCVPIDGVVLALLRIQIQYELRGVIGFHLIVSPFRRSVAGIAQNKLIFLNWLAVSTIRAACHGIEVDS